MKKCFILLGLFFILNGNLSAQIIWTVSGLDTTLTGAYGYNVTPRTSPTNLTIKNSSFTKSYAVGYVLYVGDDSKIVANMNNLDGAIITGNKIYYTGVASDVHGIIAGYNINYHINYNYFNGSAYGIVFKSGDPDDGSVMKYTEGGAAYNIFKNHRYYSVLVKAVDSVRIYNNIFYNDLDTYLALLSIGRNADGDQEVPYPYSHNAIVKNNIFYSKKDLTAITIKATSAATLDCDYNIYYCEEGDNSPQFVVTDESDVPTVYSFAQWQALGHDTHSQVIDPVFLNTTNFVPTARLNYGIDLGEDYKAGLSTSANWFLGVSPDTTAQNGTWQVGARVFDASTPSSTAYYVSPIGNDSDAGTFDEPWLTWGKAFTSIGIGDTVYFRGGVYPISITTGYGYRSMVSGISGSKTHYYAYSGETPILDCDAAITSYGGGTQNFAINANVNYAHFKGLTIRNVWQSDSADECIAWAASGDSVTIENCTIYNVHGVAFGVYAGHGFTYLNCDAHHCCDSLTTALPGNDGVGFRPYNMIDATASVSFINCRAWMCGDQGFSAGYIGLNEYIGCWSFNNGILEGEGHGFKMGWIGSTAFGPLKRLYKNNVSAYNRANGFTTNDQGYNTQTMHIYNNTVYHNGYPGGYTGVSYGFMIYNTAGSDETELARTYNNNISYYNEDGAVYVGSGALYTHSNNTWDIPLTLTDADFISVDSTGISAVRQADGSLPDNDCYKYFLRPSSTFQGYQQGVDVGLTYDAVDSLWRTPPSIGFKEYYPTTPAVDPVLADVSTYNPIWLTTTTASTGGFVSDDGGGTVSARGVCWNTTGTPTTSDSKTENGTGGGPFTSTMTGLTQGTTYYVRAYATNETGTAYGTQMTFRTQIIKHLTKVIKHLGIFMIIN